MGTRVSGRDLAVTLKEGIIADEVRNWKANALKRQMGPGAPRLPYSLSVLPLALVRLCGINCEQDIFTFGILWTCLSNQYSLGLLSPKSVAKLCGADPGRYWAPTTPAGCAGNSEGEAVHLFEEETVGSVTQGILCRDPCALKLCFVVLSSAQAPACLHKRMTGQGWALTSPHHFKGNKHQSGQGDALYWACPRTMFVQWSYGHRFAFLRPQGHLN